jgi:molecular chaperone DnaK (HSP70)
MRKISDAFHALVASGPKTLKVPDQPVRVIGIDLGTTNSTIAEIIWDPDQPGEVKPRCVEVSQETMAGDYTHILIPSAVALHQSKAIIGEGAKRLFPRSAELGLESYKDIFLECKNDMGNDRTYHRAPQGYRSAAEIGGHVLKFLAGAASQQGGIPISHTVVTVPASFQISQRQDTVKAAELAGITIANGDLLDEPIAALFDYLVAFPEKVAEHLTGKKNLVVFDFGGGTCDVAVFQLEQADLGGRIGISPLAVSRYHRLGGGDIDRAIVHQVLIPQLIEQNRLNSFDIGFEDRKNKLEPALLGVAEALKMGLCDEIRTLISFGKYKSSDKTTVIKIQPGLHTCYLNHEKWELRSPALSAKQFEDLLVPFLDSDLLYARETEYFLTCSIFAPIQDALDRCGLETKDVGLCLLVGGSCLIPQVSAAVRKYFDKATIFQHDNPDAIQVAVAKGAACHALSLALYGHGLFQVKAQEPINVSTASGPVEIIPKGAALPYPAEGWNTFKALTVPSTSIKDPVAMKVEITAGPKDDVRILFSQTWFIPAPVNQGDRLILSYRLDGNQVFDFKLRLESDPEGEGYDGQIQNPLTNVVNPNKTRILIQQDEEELRTGSVPKRLIPSKIVEIAQNYAKIKQYEKAISYLQRALRMGDSPDPNILNLMGIYSGHIGDTAHEEKYYRESAAQGGGSASLFNLALSQKERGKNQEALKTVEEAVEEGADGPTMTLQSMLQEKTGDKRGSEKSIKEAFELFRPFSAMTDWELGWYITACKMSGRDSDQEKAKKEMSRRGQKGDMTGGADGMLPGLSGDLVRR